MLYGFLEHSRSNQMKNHGLHSQFLSAGMPEDQIEIALSYFYGSGGAPEITSEGDYSAAKALYAAMDATVPPHDLHSPVARYVLTLGARVTEWETKTRQPLVRLSNTGSDLSSSY